MHGAGLPPSQRTVTLLMDRYRNDASLDLDVDASALAAAAAVTPGDVNRSRKAELLRRMQADADAAGSAGGAHVPPLPPLRAAAADASPSAAGRTARASEDAAARPPARDGGRRPRAAAAAAGNDAGRECALAIRVFEDLSTIEWPGDVALELPGGLGASPAKAPEPSVAGDAAVAAGADARAKTGSIQAQLRALKARWQKLSKAKATPTTTE